MITIYGRRTHRAWERALRWARFAVEVQLLELKEPDGFAAKPLRVSNRSRELHKRYAAVMLVSHCFTVFHDLIGRQPFVAASTLRMDKRAAGEAENA